MHNRVGEVGRILRYRAQLRRHEAWSRADLEAQQRRALAALRAFARERSAFYSVFHRGTERAPLEALPVLTKATLMDRFDEIVTDRNLKLTEIQSYLENLADDELLHGRYWVSATSGSSGRRSIIPSDANEWATVIASYARANEWSGVRVSLLRHTRMAIVSSRTPFHQSARVGRTIETPMVETCRLDAAQPIGEILRALDDFEPEVLVAYASMIRILAEEQIAGNLHIRPRHVNCSSEVLTPEARERAEEAWGVPVFEVYAATETGGIAAECDRHTGLHLFEDLVIPEVVDDAYRPVAPGVTGSRLLVSVLFSRTLPLIRYELTDRVTLAPYACSCGRPFRLVQSVDGRTDDALELPALNSGLVRVHPNVFSSELDLLHAAGWQVRKEAHGLRVLIERPDLPLNPESLAERIERGLVAAGAERVPLRIEQVDEIPAGAAGKRPLVVAQPLPLAHGF